jgi:hypothetical protein
MPISIPDLAWYVSTGSVVILMSIITVMLGWGFSLLIKKLEYITSKLDSWVVETARMQSRLEDHIEQNNREHSVLFEKLRGKK